MLSKKLVEIKLVEIKQWNTIRCTFQGREYTIWATSIVAIVASKTVALSGLGRKWHENRR